MTVLAFSTRAYASMRDAIVKLGAVDAGDIEAKTFPDGERYLRLTTPVEGRDVALLGGTVTDSDTMELYDLACGIVKYGARSLTLLVPYYGYSTMERAVKRGEVVTAKTRARLFSSIPHATAPNTVVLVDVHTEGLPHYFEAAIRAVHLYAKPVVLDLVREVGGKDFVLACTDAGRAKWVESLANDLGVPASFVFKRREDDGTTQVTAVSAQVAGKCVVIYDDMIRTGGSLMGAARAYADAGARNVAAVCTHGLFPGDALDRLNQSRLFSAIACTDTHPRASELEGKGLRVASVAGLLHKGLTEGFAWRSAGG
jgi:ribose-phosphate pyrophosphokinase